MVVVTGSSEYIHWYFDFNSLSWAFNVSRPKGDLASIIAMAFSTAGTIALARTELISETSLIIPKVVTRWKHKLACIKFSSGVTIHEALQLTKRFTSSLHAVWTFLSWDLILRSSSDGASSLTAAEQNSTLFGESLTRSLTRLRASGFVWWCSRIAHL